LADTIDAARIGDPPPNIPIDLSGSDRHRFGLKPHELIARDYTRNRYLKAVPDDQLMARMQDILANFHIINPSGQISVNLNDHIIWYWLAKTTEVQMEMELRHGPYPAGWNINAEGLPGSLRQVGKRENFILKPSADLPKRFLLKYGRKERLQPLLKKGELRIMPAADYKDESLTTAIRDDELLAQISYDPVLYFLKGNSGISSHDERNSYHRRANSNFYVACFSDRLEPRLVVDFDGDACLLIRDPDAFVQRLGGAVLAQLPGWEFIVRDIEYYDPLRISPTEIKLPFSKHFKYAYQQEVRLVWVPPTPCGGLPPLWIEIGNMDGIAELIVPG